MTGWFGKSWGAPCCDPEDHVATPIGKSCLHCGELILAGHHGFTMPLVHLDGSATVEVSHYECFMRRILPHGRECPHCRGKARSEHALRCNHRQTGGDCNCVALEDV